MKEMHARALKAVLLFCLASTIPLVVSMYLNSGTPAWQILAAAAATQLLFFLRQALTRIWKRIVTLLLSVMYIAVGALLIVYVIVIPYEVYNSWIGLVRAGGPGGMISVLFTASIFYFSSLFSGIAWNSGTSISVTAMFLAVLFHATVIFPSIEIIIVFSLCAACLLVMLASQRKRFRLAESLRDIPLFAATALVAMLLSSGGVPAIGILGSRNLDPQIKKLLVDAFADLPELAVVAGYGYSFEDHYLGGKPGLAETPLLEVRSRKKKIIYLRTGVSYYYVKNSWYRQSGPEVQDAQTRETEAVAEGLLNRNEADDDAVTLTVTMDYLAVLPHLLSVKAIGLPGQNIQRTLTGFVDTGFSLNLPLLKNDTIVISSGHSGIFPPAYDLALVRQEVEETLNFKIETQVIPSGRALTGLLEESRQVPREIPDRVRDLASRLGANETQSWKILANIYDYLRKNCAYSLKTQAPPLGTDFTDHFLFTTKKGYSVHFATAFILLARLNHIPARYVEGFFVYIPDKADTTVVKGMNAHVWPEVWFPGLGWTSLEACPAMDMLTKYGPEYYRMFNPENDELTGKQLAAIMGGKIQAPDMEKHDYLACILPLIPWTAAGACGLGIILIAVSFLKRRCMIDRRYGHGIHGKISRQLYRLVSYAQKRSVPSPEEIGWRAWGKQFPLAHKVRPGLVNTIVLLVQRLYFTPRMPTRNHLRFFKAIRRKIT